MELLCVPQIYDWGKHGRDSLVATLLESAYPNSFTVDENVPYAELWMGTHCNGESVLRETGETLHRHLQTHPQVMGNALKHLGGELPFLFKVLSINKALSIQVHPDKETAQELNRLFPERYKDSNHKPELAVALTPFEMLAGFRPLEEIMHFLKVVPELSSLIKQEVLHNFTRFEPKASLKDIFTELMGAQQSKIKENVSKLLRRLESSVSSIKLDQLYELVDRLHKQFPNDIGIFAVYFLNHINLEPGQGLFMSSGIPHAYLKGDIVECMASSDNVVRAGLTPKFRDVTTLCNILDYKSYKPQELVIEGRKPDKCCTTYKMPVPDFSLARIEIPKGEKYDMPRQYSCSIVIVLEGQGESTHFRVHPGVVVFLDTMADVSVTAHEKVLMFQAFSNP